MTDPTRKPYRLTWKQFVQIVETSLAKYGVDDATLECMGVWDEEIDGQPVLVVWPPDYDSPLKIVIDRK